MDYELFIIIISILIGTFILFFLSTDNNCNKKYINNDDYAYDCFDYDE